jgi:hypothetical protein
MNIRSPLKPHAQSPVLMQPRKRPLHNPAILPQSAPMLGVATGQYRLDPASPQLFPMWFRVIRAIPQNFLGSLAGTTPLALQRRNAVHKRKQLGHIMRVGSRQARIQWNSMSLGDEVMLAARTPSVCGIRPCFFPRRPQPAPKTNPRSRVSSQSLPPDAGVPVECDKSSPRCLLSAIRGGGSSTSCRIRIPSREAAFPKGCRISGRTGCLSGHADHRAVFGPDAEMAGVLAGATGAV